MYLIDLACARGKGKLAGGLKARTDDEPTATGIASGKGKGKGKLNEG